MFHHFPDELNGTMDYLVRSTDLEYNEGSVASFIASITQAGYAQKADRTYFKKALPKRSGFSKIGALPIVTLAPNRP